MVNVSPCLYYRTLRRLCVPLHFLTPSPAQPRISDYLLQVYTDALGNASTQTVSHNSHFLTQGLPDTVVEIPTDAGGLVAWRNP